MNQTTADLDKLRDTYHAEGWCAPPLAVDASTLALLRAELEAIAATTRDEVVMESDGSAVRALHGCHTYSEIFQALVSHPVLVSLATGILGGDVYVYQFKINIKAARQGGEWPWHQDFSFWHLEDGMAEPNAVNIAICLDRIDDLNGPLKVISGSHDRGLLHDGADTDGPNREDDWRAHVSTDLTYTVSPERIGSLCAEARPISMHGERGAIHVFHPSVVHSSTSNLSPNRRALLLITYNRVDNAPARPSRPEFLVSRDTTPLRPMADDRLVIA
jgi:ectoine hydroxylase